MPRTGIREGTSQCSVVHKQRSRSPTSSLTPPRPAATSQSPPSPTISLFSVGCAGQVGGDAADRRPWASSLASCRCRKRECPTPDPAPAPPPLQPAATSSSSAITRFCVCSHVVMHLSTEPRGRASGALHTHAERAVNQARVGGLGLTKYALASRRASRPECVGTAKPLICATEFGSNLSLHLCPRNRAAWR